MKKKEQKKDREAMLMFLGVLIASFLAYVITLFGNASYDLMIGEGGDRTQLIFTLFGVLTLFAIRALFVLIEITDGMLKFKDLERGSFVLNIYKFSSNKSWLGVLPDMVFFIAFVFYLIKPLTWLFSII